MAGADARRLKIIKRLLSDDGSLWITIDDNEAHYLKVLCDEIFGRGNFVANVVWKKSSPQANAVWLSDNHDHRNAAAKGAARVEDQPQKHHNGPGGRGDEEKAAGNRCGRSG